MKLPKVSGSAIEIMRFLGFPTTTAVHSIEQVKNKHGQSVVRCEFTHSEGEETVVIDYMIFYLAALKAGRQNETT